MVLTPGLSYIVHAIIPELATPLVLSIAAHRATYHYGIGEQFVSTIRPSVAFVVLFGATLTGKFLIRRAWTWLTRYIDRKRLGAESIPTLGGVLPGNIDTIRRLTKESHTWHPGEPFINLKKEYGPIYNLGFLWEDTVYTDHPMLIKEILSTDFNNYIKGENFQAGFFSMLGTGIFNSDGDVWKFHRSMARPFFTRDRVTDFDIFDKHAKLTLTKICERCDSGDPVDFQEVIARFTMDSAVEFLFGASIHSLAAPLRLPGGKPATDTNVHKFTESFQRVLHIVEKRILWRSSGWQLLEMLGDKTAADMRVIYDFIEPILDEALRKAKDKSGAVKEDIEEQDTLLSHLVALSDDRQMIRDELLNILLAGRDTTAATLTFVTYLLAMYPQVLERLREEVFEVVGPHERPTFDHIRDMKYMRAVINETIRLFPPVPGNTRDSIQSRAWTDPDTGRRYYIPAKTRVLYNVLNLQRDPSCWGPDANDFSPERWLDDRKQYYLANPFIFVPFQAGPRICLGQQFAYNEVSFFLVRLLQQFGGMELAPEGQPEGTLPPAIWKEATGTRKQIERIRPMSDVTMRVEGGLWMRFKPGADPTTYHTKAGNTN